MDVGEDDIELVMAELTNNRSWKQNKDLKRAARRDREYFGSKGRGGGPPRPEGRGRMRRDRPERGGGAGRRPPPGRRRFLTQEQLMK
eukprot:3883428-Pyramimonas_sp.AAC.1